MVATASGSSIVSLRGSFLNRRGPELSRSFRIKPPVYDAGGGQFLLSSGGQFFMSPDMGEVESAPTLPPFAIARCFSVQYPKLLPAPKVGRIPCKSLTS